jgi:phenylpyruvate tautomerase
LGLYLKAFACQSTGIQKQPIMAVLALPSPGSRSQNRAMPLLTVVCSEPVEREKAQQVLSDLSKWVAEALGKPERYVATCLTTRAAMTFAGSAEPTCLVELANIGQLDPKLTEHMSRELCQRIGQELAVPLDRIYVRFSEVERHLWGQSSGTFA